MAPSALEAIQACTHSLTFKVLELGRLGLAVSYLCLWILSAERYIETTAAFKAAHESMSVLVKVWAADGLQHRAGADDMTLSGSAGHATRA